MYYYVLKTLTMNNRIIY